MSDEATDELDQADALASALSAAISPIEGHDAGGAALGVVRALHRLGYRIVKNTGDGMSNIDGARVIAAIEAEWNYRCAGNRNEDVCETCRAYGETIRTVEWIRDHTTAGEATA